MYLPPNEIKKYAELFDYVLASDDPTIKKCFENLQLAVELNRDNAVTKTGPFMSLVVANAKTKINYNIQYGL